MKKTCDIGRKISRLLELSGRNVKSVSSFMEVKDLVHSIGDDLIRFEHAIEYLRKQVDDLQRAVRRLEQESGR